MAATTDPDALLRSLATGIPESQQQWSRGTGLGGQPTPEPAPKEPWWAVGKTTEEKEAFIQAEAERRVAAEEKEAERRVKAKEDFANGTTADAPKSESTEAKPDTKADPPEPKPDAKTGKGSGALEKVGLPPETLRQLKAEPLQGVKGLGIAQWDAGQRISGKGADKVAEKLKAKGLGKVGIKAAGRALPVVGSLYAGYSAYKDFKSGDYVGMAFNILGVIPGPVGWIGLGLATAWDLAGWGSKIGEWAKPDGETVWMLQAAAKDVAGVTSSDSLIRQAQLDVFRFQDGPTGTVWDSNPPAAVRLDTAEVKAAVESYFNGLSDLFAQIEKAMADSGEQYFAEQRQQLAPHLTAMAQLKSQVQPLMAQLTAASDGAKTSYDGVLAANKAARQQISEGGTLSDSGPATTMKTQVQQGSSAIAAANSKIGQLFAETPPPVVMARGTTAPTGTRPAATKPQEVKPTTPAPVTPSVATAPQATPAKTETPTKTDDTLSKLLSQLGQNKAPTATNPLGNTGTGLGGGSPLGSQGLGGGQGGGTPLSASKPDTSTKSEPKKLSDDKPERKREEPKKLSDDKSLSGPKPENAKAAVPAPEAKPAPAAAPVATPAPAAGPTPAQQNAAHAAAAQEPSKEVDVKGNKTTFPDAKTAKMAELLSKADPTHPVSLADAAKAAGLTPPTPGQDPGKQVAPTDAKPGDLLVAGGKNFMLLGDGKFYDLSDYKVVGAGEIPQNLGERAGYFHLVDPSPGQPAVPGSQTAAAPPQGPVSPQSTAGVPFPVPNATGTPQGPVDASQAPAPPGGVPAAGTPGVPKPGAPGSGPANAAATDTGTGVGGPSTSGQPLDPGAVR